MSPQQALEMAREIAAGSFFLLTAAVLMAIAGCVVPSGPRWLRGLLCFLGAHDVGWTAGHYWCSFCPFDQRGEDWP